MEWLTEHGARLRRLAVDAAILVGVAAVDVGLLNAAVYRAVAAALAALSGS